LNAENITFSYSQAVPVKYALEHFAELSFPNLRTRIINNKISNPLMVVMAKKGEEIVGLSIASRQRKSTSDILTLMVKPEFRLNGIGTKLIKQMNRLQAENGHSVARIFFFNHWKNKEFIDKLQKKHFWSSPKTTLYRFEHDYSITKNQILPSGLVLDDEYSFRSWAKLTAEERNLHFKAEDREDIKPLYRFSNYTRRLIPELSHVLEKNGVIIGWCIAIQANNKSIEHTLFILPEHRRSPLLPIALITKNWLRQFKSEYQKAVWLIDSRNGSMLRFMKKKLPHLVHTETSLKVVSKEISNL